MSASIYFAKVEKYVSVPDDSGMRNNGPCAPCARIVTTASPASTDASNERFTKDFICEDSKLEIASSGHDQGSLPWAKLIAKSADRRREIAYYFLDWLEPYAQTDKRIRDTELLPLVV